MNVFIYYKILTIHNIDNIVTIIFQKISLPRGKCSQLPHLDLTVDSLDFLARAIRTIHESLNFTNRASVIPNFVSIVSNEYALLSVVHKVLLKLVQERMFQTNVVLSGPTAPTNSSL